MTEKKKRSKRSNGTAATKAAGSKAGSKPAAAANGAYTPSDEEIARRAYALWEGRGKPIGSPEEDWHRAKQELGANA